MSPYIEDLIGIFLLINSQKCTNVASCVIVMCSYISRKVCIRLNCRVSEGFMVT